MSSRRKQRRKAPDFSRLGKTFEIEKSGSTGTVRTSRRVKKPQDAARVVNNALSLRRRQWLTTGEIPPRSMPLQPSTTLSTAPKGGKTPPTVKRSQNRRVDPTQARATLAAIVARFYS